jgi:antitoxin ParD1/3/4
LLYSPQQCNADAILNSLAVRAVAACRIGQNPWAATCRFGAFMTSVTISLPAMWKTFIDEQIAAKGYGNVSEYFRALLRDAREREEEARLAALLAEGLATGGGDILLTHAFWKDLKAEALVLAQKHQARAAALIEK